MSKGYLLVSLLSLFSFLPTRVSAQRAEVAVGDLIQLEVVGQAPFKIKGTIHSFSATDLTLIPSLANPTRHLEVEWNQISALFRSDGVTNSAVKGSLYGSIAAGLLGYLSVVSTDNHSGSSCRSWGSTECFQHDLERAAAMGTAVIGAFIGFAFGAVIGHSMKNYNWVEVKLQPVVHVPIQGDPVAQAGAGLLLTF